MKFAAKYWLLTGSYLGLLSVGVFLLLSQGAAYRYALPPEPPEWELPCSHEIQGQQASEPFVKCPGYGSAGSGRNIFILGDSHAVQFVFPLMEAAHHENMTLYYPNRPPTDYDSYPYSFWEGQIASDSLIDFVVANANPGDFFITSIHRGRFNPSRDFHISQDFQFIDQSERASNFESNMRLVLPKLGEAGLTVYLVKDTPLLPDSMTSMSACMYQFQSNSHSLCDISLEQDLHTRAQLNRVFDKLNAFYEFVEAVDPAPELFRGGLFRPISNDGEYRMRDKHHLSEKGAMELTCFFEGLLLPAGSTPSGASCGQHN